VWCAHCVLTIVEVVAAPHEERQTLATFAHDTLPVSVGCVLMEMYQVRCCGNTGQEIARTSQRSQCSARPYRSRHKLLVRPLAVMYVLMHRPGKCVDDISADGHDKWRACV
jgi:hypothetical protein